VDEDKRGSACILSFHVTSSFSKVKKSINPSVVLVPSDVRLSSSLTFLQR